jgi:RNA polymerase sigma-70 factor (ECF subfamily)
MVLVSHKIEALWEELSRPLRAFFARAARSEDADDLLQECFLRVIRGIDEVQDDDRLAAWVQRIARNLVIDAHRGRRVSEDPVEDLAAEYHTEDLTEDLNRVVGGWVAAGIDGLPERYREPVRLYELEGVPQREIAERLGLSLSAVKSRVQRGRSLLRSDLLACCSFEFDRTGGVVDYRRHSDPDCGC